MNYCSLFLYFSFFSPFFFFVFGRVTWMLAHFLSCPKRERGEQSAESSGKRRTERKQRNQRREWEGIYLSLLSLPRAFRRDTKRLQNQRGEHYSSPCQGAFDVPTYSMCIYICTYIHIYYIYVVIYVYLQVYTLECMSVFANVLSGRLLCGYARVHASAADCMTHRRPRPRRLGSRLRHRSRLRCPSPPVRCRRPLPPPSPWFSSPSRAPRAAPSRKHARSKCLSVMPF